MNTRRLDTMLAVILIKMRQLIQKEFLVSLDIYGRTQLFYDYGRRSQSAELFDLTQQLVDLDPTCIHPLDVASPAEVIESPRLSGRKHRLQRIYRGQVVRLPDDSSDR